ncbi:hypothetical protein HELRODRAFT_64084, partial [Helobdella robusta]|uniref:NlpC/P60 domain-containing protein n=1 Tax=Helobdella robusta TaxID=6412 RepID=T1FXP0_HELRO
PLFLDCCGLVRRIMRDLRKNFGFCLGPWNQSYQYDTLPNVIEKLEDVLPGDLVFTAATFYKPRVKPQKHDLTHVEIFLGQGAKTIGSRWHAGKVQEFEDFKFVSTSYHSQKYIFKSIDTWLKGVCKRLAYVH